MGSWIVVLKSIGSFIVICRIGKNIIGLPFTKFNDRIILMFYMSVCSLCKKHVKHVLHVLSRNNCVIKQVMNFRLKDLLNSPSARPINIFFQALVQIKVYYYATVSFKMRSLNITEFNSFLLLGHVTFNKIFH